LEAEAEAETATATVATRETRIKQQTIGDDPIKRMTWSLGSDNKIRYPGRVKMLFDYLGLTIAGDEDYESFRKAAVEFVRMVKENSEQVEDMLRDFITNQELRVQKGEIKRVTIVNYIKAVKSFCQMNRIARFIEWTLISKGLPSGRKPANDRAPTAEELVRLIGSDDLRLKLIICIMASSGIRIGAWNYLKIKHITPIRKGDVTLAWIVVYADQYIGKSKQYNTLISPEAYQVLQEYITSRKSAGEKIDGELGRAGHMADDEY
jgi:integrase